MSALAKHVPGDEACAGSNLESPGRRTQATTLDEYLVHDSRIVRSPRPVAGGVESEESSAFLSVEPAASFVKRHGPTAYEGEVRGVVPDVGSRYASDGWTNGPSQAGVVQGLGVTGLTS